MNLADLIRRTKGDRTYAELSTATGGAITAQRLQQMASSARGSEFPKPANIAALARALRVSERTVVLAAASTAGLDVDVEDGVGALLPGAGTSLTDRQVATILQLVQVMNDRTSQEEVRSDGNATATSGAKETLAPVSDLTQRQAQAPKRAARRGPKKSDGDDATD